MKLFYDNQVDIANVFSDEASVNYPASNVQDTRLSRFFRGDKSINFDITGAGGIKHIYQEYTNLALSPTDLRAAGSNWVSNNTTDELSTLSINGNLFTKIINDGANQGFNQQSFTASFINNILTGRISLKKGDSVNNTTRFSIQEVGIATLFSILPDWDNFGSEPATPSSGTLLDYTWIDEETLELHFKCEALTNLANNVNIRCYGSNNATAAEYTYWTEVTLIDKSEITMFPFVDGTHAADVIDETDNLSAEQTYHLRFNPGFAFDKSGNPNVLTYWIDGTHYFRFRYISSIDKWRVSFLDGGSVAHLDSQQFGTGFTNLNQIIDFFISVKLHGADQTGSRFIIIPKDSGNLFEDSIWTTTPDNLSSAFTTASIGWDGVSGEQIDSDYEFVRKYEGLMVGTVSNLADAEEIIKDKKILLDKTYMKRLTATDLLIANTTINAGDTITLRANDVDSFGSGSPVDESIDYDGSDILTHNFTKASYQYWRLIVNSSNVIDFGRVYLGLGYSTPVISWEIGDSFQSDTKKTRTPSGVTYGDLRIKYELISIKWMKILTATEKPALKAAFDAFDISKPFFVTFDDSVSLLGTFYVTIDGTGLHFVYYRNPVYSKAAISFIEEIG